MPETPRFNERTIVFLVGAVQFVNILDFLMVMPLGPDFAGPLHFPESKLGLVAGSYTAAAAVAGLAGSFFLDRFDRRSALGVCMLGLVIGTATGGFARDLPSLMAARVLAGIFGGPATSLALSIIADTIPPERRGKAMGAVMGSLSVAQVLGVPAGLKLAEWGGWRMPFFAVAGMGLVIAGLAIFALPPLRLHLEGAAGRTRLSLAELLSRPTVRLSYLMTAVTMASGFLLIPNLSAYAQRNLGLPRDDLDLLYLCAGAAGFITLRRVGALVDRVGSFRTSLGATALWLAVLYFGFLDYPRWLPVIVIFIFFSISLSARNVAYNTLTTKVPLPRERARFLSIQSAVAHSFTSAGAILSSRLIYTRPDHTLGGVPLLAVVSMGLAVALPPLLRMVESRVSQPGL